MKNILLQSLKSKPKRQLYSSAAILRFISSWIMRPASVSWPMAVLSCITLLIGVAAFLIGLTKKEEPDPNSGGTEFVPSTKQLKLLVICSLLFAMGKLFSLPQLDNTLAESASYIFIFATFSLLIFAAPKKHKPPVIFLMAFLVCFLIYLYFFEQ